MDKNVHYSKMSKARKKPRKAFPERWEMMPGGSSVFRTDRGGGALTPPHFGLSRFIAGAYSRPNFGRLLCHLFVDFHAVISCSRGFPHTKRKNRSERRVGGHRGIYRTRPDAEHIPPSPHFHTFSSIKAR